MERKRKEKEKTQNVNIHNFFLFLDKHFIRISMFYKIIFILYETYMTFSPVRYKYH